MLRLVFTNFSDPRIVVRFMVRIRDGRGSIWRSHRVRDPAYTFVRAELEASLYCRSELHIDSSNASSINLRARIGHSHSNSRRGDILLPPQPSGVNDLPHRTGAENCGGAHEPRD